MSYREEGNSVTLTMSRQDYEYMIIALGQSVGLALQGRGQFGLPVIVSLVNRLNSGNPNYTPYVEKP